MINNDRKEKLKLAIIIIPETVAEKLKHNPIKKKRKKRKKRAYRQSVVVL